MRKREKRKVRSYYRFWWKECDACGEYFRKEIGTRIPQHQSWGFYYCQECSEKDKRSALDKWSKWDE